ncbi:DUF305 domain-containing protein [soil metagenome]
MPPDQPDATTDDPIDDPTDDGVIVLPWWQNPRNIVTLIVTTALLAGMAGWFVGRSSEDIDTSNVDVGFLQDMRVHHEQAVNMSFIYLDRPDIDPQLVVVADSILFGQSVEIGMMRQLLDDMGADGVGDPDDAMAWMGMSPMNENDMPGMATSAQLDELARSSGTDADALFGQLMSAHHQGGIDMSEFAAANAENGRVRQLAASWAVSQRDEIAEMNQLVEPTD